MFVSLETVKETRINVCEASVNSHFIDSHRHGCVAQQEHGARTRGPSESRLPAVLPALGSRLLCRSRRNPVRLAPAKAAGKPLAPGPGPPVAATVAAAAWSAGGAAAQSTTRLAPLGSRHFSMPSGRGASPTLAKESPVLLRT